MRPQPLYTMTDIVVLSRPILLIRNNRQLQSIIKELSWI